MDIKVIGTGCDKCSKLYDSTQQAIQELKLDAKLEKVEDLVEMIRLGVMTTPSLWVDGKVVSSGRVLTKDQVMKLLQK